MKTLILILVLCGQVSSANSFGRENDNRAKTDWKKLFHQLFYWNIAKNPDPEKWNADILRNQRRHSIYYSRDDFNVTYNTILDAILKKGDGSKPLDIAFRERERLLHFDQSQNLFESPKAASDLIEDVKKTGVEASADLLQLILNDRNMVYPETVNYFNTPAGQAVGKALKDVVVVVVPGFGSHTMTDYSFAALVEEANRHYRRPALRIGRKVGNKVIYDGHSDPVNFYQENIGDQEIGLDVVHPMGYELGNSMGKDNEAADNLALWLNNLSKITAFQNGKTVHPYENKKFILIGYSKGTPIAHNMVANHPDIRARTLMITTLAGVNQGALPAEDGINSLVRGVKKAKQFDPRIAKITDPENRGGPIDPGKAIKVMEELNANVMNFVNPSLGMLLKYGAANNLLTGLFKQASGMDIVGILNGAKNLGSTDQSFEALEGAYDMTNFQRIKWNLQNLNDKVFDSPLTVLNLSVLTNQHDFLTPDAITDDEEMGASTITPRLKPDGSMDPETASKDNLFLFLTSRTGFRRAAGGLFDTQVTWLDTKSMLLDDRPIAIVKKGGSVKSGSLNDDELTLLKDYIKINKGIDLPDEWALWPRKELVKYINNQTKMTTLNLNFVDLGELRGTHWDVAFVNVYKPGRSHAFPRKAMLSALLETVAVYSAATIRN